MAIQLKRATKAKAKLRLALQGPSGGGKTYSALSIASHMVSSMDKIGVLDTEHGSAAKYSDVFNGFQAGEITGNYHPNHFMEGLAAIAEAGCEVAIIDSLTHAWNGSGGFLELVDEECRKMQAKGWKADSFAAWKTLTPLYNKLVQSILSCPIHVIVCLRAKQEYEKVKGDNGKVTVQKVGMAPEIRDNFQYEMDIEGMLTMDHDLIMGKTRCSLVDGKIFNRPGKEFANIIKRWLDDGAEPAVVEPPKIGGSDPDIAKPVAVKWSDEQKTEAGGYRAELAKYPDGEKIFSQLWSRMKQDPPSVVIDALAAELNKLREINQPEGVV